MKINKSIVEKKVIEIKEEIELYNGISVERVTTKTYINDTLDSEKSSSYYKNNKIKNGVIILFDKGVREIHRQHNIFQSEHDKMKEFGVYEYQDDPFEKIIELGDNYKDSVELLMYKFYDHTVRELDETEIPKRVRFDYMSGNIRDGYYDLDLLLEHLKQIESVELKSKVISVPYYNNYDGCRYHIEFYIRATDEEWIEILKSNAISYSESENLKAKILEFYGINKFAKEIL